MKNTIEIKVECKGVAVGTLGWFNSIIKDSELVIKNCKDGTPGMFLKAPTVKGDDMAYTFICKKAKGWEDAQYYDYNENTGIKRVYPVENDMAYGFSGYPLTPACEKKVKELIDLACEQFLEWWENN